MERYKPWLGFASVDSAIDDLYRSIVSQYKDVRLIKRDVIEGEFGCNIGTLKLCYKDRGFKWFLRAVYYRGDSCWGVQYRVCYGDLDKVIQ